MKKAIFIFVFLLSVYRIAAQPPFYQPRVFAKPKPNCDNQIKVRYNRPITCDYELGCATMYPVFFEGFDNKENLQNLWTFDLGYTKDDDVGTNCSDRCSWYGNSYNNNIEVTGGVAHLILKQESVSNVIPNDKCGTASYNFTSGMLKTINYFRTGVFEARIKIPKANKMWPAFWLLNGGRAPAYGEIDIFEFYDNSVGSSGGLTNSNCDTYGLHKMTLHSGLTGNECEQGDKYPVASNFLDDYHTYRLEWTDYDIRIYVDGHWKGIATRYFEFPSQPFSTCKWNASNNNKDPLFNYGCSAMDNQLPDELFPFIDKKVMERSHWPTKFFPMQVLINNNLNIKYKDDNIMSDFSQTDVNMLVDYVKIYQPFCCEQNRFFCSEQQLDAITYDTEILTGKTITVNDLTTNCVYRQETPHSPEWWASPTILLATDEIAFNSVVEIPGTDRYFEARIIDCNNPFKLAPNDHADEDSILHVLEQQVLDSMYAYYPEYTDSLFNVYGDSVFYQNHNSRRPGQNQKVATGSGDQNNGGLDSGIEQILISPIPAEDFIQINCLNSTFEKFKYLYLISSDGRTIRVNPTKTLDLKTFTSGVYLLKIEYQDGNVLYKRFVKT